jgi:hypothetical protein
MNSIVILCGIGVFIFLFQCIFFISCMRWLSQGKRKRDKEFAILDADRAQLISLQGHIKKDIQEAKKLADETLKKLRIIGTEAHAEWEEVTKKINSVLVEVEQHSDVILKKNIEQLNIQKLSLDKSIQESHLVIAKLTEKSSKAQQILGLFDTGLPTDEILKEIQANKYEDAKRMLLQGVEASMVSKKLGISMSEIVLISALT